MFLMLTFHFLLSPETVHMEDDPNRFMTRGEIYIETENGFFPCFGWGDRILSSVSMWLNNAIKLLDPKIGEFNVMNYFMDGPYSFTIQKMPEDRISVKFIRQIGESEKEELPFVEIELIEYCVALLNLGENIVQEPNFQWYGKEQERTNFQRNVILLKTWLTE